MGYEGAGCTAAYTATMRFNFFLNSKAGQAARKAVLLPALLLVPAASLPFASPISAQRPAARTVDGTVTAGGTPVKGAVVHLKDTRSLSQKSYITAEDGTYRFAQLSGTTDYEVWAEANGKKSSVKSISSFDTKNAFSIALKMD